MGRAAAGGDNAGVAAPPPPPASPRPTPVPPRYRTQARFRGLGPAGQANLARGRVVVVGCGATGSVLAETLVRAGVGLKSAGGWVRVCDRDFVEESNLPRQTLYTRADARGRTPKAVAAAARLSAVEPAVQIEPHVTDVTAGNIERLAAGADLYIDGADNFEARLLVNDLSLETGVPWVFCGAVGSAGQAMPIFPHETACLRCLMPAPPPPGTGETCDTAGVVLPAVHYAAGAAAAWALKILAGNEEEVTRFKTDPHLWTTDVWAPAARRVGTKAMFEGGECPACLGGRGDGERAWLRGGRGDGAATLCGRGGVQLAAPGGGARVDLAALADRWRAAAGEASVRANRFLCAVTVPELELGRGPGEVTVFADGRVIITGTTDVARARQAKAAWAG